MIDTSIERIGSTDVTRNVQYQRWVGTYSIYWLWL